MKYEYIIFDFDGVVVDSKEVKEDAYVEVFRNFGAKYSSAIRELYRDNVGKPRELVIKTVLSCVIGKECSSRQIAALSDAFSTIAFTNVIKKGPIPGLSAFLGRWQGTVQYVIVSLSPVAEVVAFLEACSLHDYFLDVKGGPANKAHNITTLLTQYDVEPLHVLHIGDTVADYAISRNIGCKFIRMRSPGATWGEQNGVDVDAIDGYAELDKWLEASMRRGL
ncbi:MAG: HAD hydrolase-like protein [Planctomycetota bacterium]